MAKRKRTRKVKQKPVTAGDRWMILVMMGLMVGLSVWFWIKNH